MSTGRRIVFPIALALLLALAWTAEPAVAQKQTVKRGQGQEVNRTNSTSAEKSRPANGSILRKRSERAGAERGRTSGRVERRDRDGRVIESRDGRKDGSRTSSSRIEDIIFGRDDAPGERRGGERGPKFCQTGQGHPVHGMAWCQEKGFGRMSDRWDLRRDRDLRDVIIGVPDREPERRGNKGRVR